MQSTIPSLSMTWSLSTDELQPQQRSMKLMSSFSASAGTASTVSRKSSAVDWSAVLGLKIASKRGQSAVQHHPSIRAHTKKRIILANFRVLCDFGAVLFWIIATVSIRTSLSLARRRSCGSPCLAGFSPCGGGRPGRDVLWLIVFVVVAVVGLARSVISITALALSRVSWMHASMDCDRVWKRVANANHLVDGRWSFERVLSVSVLLVLLLYRSLWPREGGQIKWLEEVGSNVLRRSFAPCSLRFQRAKETV